MAGIWFIQLESSISCRAGWLPEPWRTPWAPWAAGSGRRIRWPPCPLRRRRRTRPSRAACTARRPAVRRRRGRSARWCSAPWRPGARRGRRWWARRAGCGPRRPGASPRAAWRTWRRRTGSPARRRPRRSAAPTLRSPRRRPRASRPRPLARSRPRSRPRWCTCINYSANAAVCKKYSIDNRMFALLTRSKFVHFEMFMGSKILNSCILDLRGF